MQSNGKAWSAVAWISNVALAHPLEGWWRLEDNGIRREELLRISVGQDSAMFQDSAEDHRYREFKSIFIVHGLNFLIELLFVQASLLFSSCINFSLNFYIWQLPDKNGSFGSHADSMKYNRPASLTNLQPIVICSNHHQTQIVHPAITTLTTLTLLME